MTVVDRVPVDRIGAEAAEIQFVRTAATLLVGVFFAVGWIAGKTWTAVAWAAAAVKVGWIEARGRARREAA